MIFLECLSITIKFLDTSLTVNILKFKLRGSTSKQSKWNSKEVLPQNNANGIANTENPVHTAPLGLHCLPNLPIPTSPYSSVVRESASGAVYRWFAPQPLMLSASKIDVKASLYHYPKIWDH